MKKHFNIAKDYGLIIDGFKVPKGAFYGYDEKSKFICINYPSPNYEGHKLDLIRWLFVSDAKGCEWTKTTERNATTTKIMSIIRENNNPDLLTFRPKDSKTLEKKKQEQEENKAKTQFQSVLPKDRKPQIIFEPIKNLKRYKDYDPQSCIDKNYKDFDRFVVNDDRYWVTFKK